MPVLLRLADLERASLEQRVDHLEEKERIAADLGQQIGAHLACPVTHPEPRLDQTHVLLRGQSAKPGAEQPLDHVEPSVIGTSDHEHEDRQRIAAVNDLAKDVEARLVSPMRPLYDEHEWLGDRDGSEQTAHASDDVLLAPVRKLVIPSSCLSIGRAL